MQDHGGFVLDRQTGLQVRSEGGNHDVVPRSIVVDEQFEWDGVESPGIPLEELVIYELHVRGFTRHPTAGVRHPGTYLGLIEKIPHLCDLGVNAVELMPVQEACTEQRLRALGLRNYWGYNPVALFAPESSYSTLRTPGCQVDEFKTMVKALHESGIEVILDIVFNHTGEQDHLGPTLCFRGIDNSMYYRLDPADPSHYLDWTGCGNTLDFSRREVVSFAVECLRYWVEHMHVDGFRFDLAPILGRGEDGEFDPEAPFFRAIQDDSIFERVKFIAEHCSGCVTGSTTVACG